MLFRISRLTYRNLGFSEHRKKSRIPLRTAYVLVGEKCNNSCIFCSFSSKSEKKDRKWLARVDWMVVEPEEFFKRFNSSRELVRVCFQLPADEKSIDRVQKLIFQHRVTTGKKISVSAWLDAERIAGFVNAGVDNIALNIDVVSPETHTDVKGGDLFQKIGFLSDMAVKYSYIPGLFTTHVIVGTGETDRQLLDFLSVMKCHGVTVGLFSYTPAGKTKRAFLKRPAIKRYRLVQLMKELIEKADEGYEFKFDPSGQLQQIVVSEVVYSQLLKTASTFSTSGCSDCSRPYYNDSPSESEPYNYFTKMTPEEYNRIIETLPVSIARTSHERISSSK